jgi:nucleotide-binding universal stress UspA family protein
MGFEEERVQIIFRKKERDVAMDACRWSQNKEADAILLSRHGRTGLEDFLMGEISKKVVDHCQFCPVWIVDGKIDSINVLLCIDNSENALRAVDHAGFMLAGTDCRVTLFHSMRHPSQMFPSEVLEDGSDLDQLWKEKAGKQIASCMTNAREMLLRAGFTEDRIALKVVDGGRSPADDILEEARKNDFGTLILGRRGLSAFKEFFMGSVTSKVLSRALGLATWIVQ